MPTQLTLFTRHTATAVETGSVTHTIRNFVKYIAAEFPEITFKVISSSLNWAQEDVAIVELNATGGIDDEEYTSSVEDLGEMLGYLDIVLDYRLGDGGDQTAPQADGQNQTPASQ